MSKKFRVGADAHIGPLRNVRFSVGKSVKSIDFTYIVPVAIIALYIIGLVNFNWK